MVEKELKQYKHFFFDMDGTLTESRSVISKEMKEELARLKYLGKDIIIVSGASEAQIFKQLDLSDSGDRPDYFILAQSGNHVFSRCGLGIMWQNDLSDDDLRVINDHIWSCLQFRGLTDTTDLVEYRGGQVSFSLVGHNADLAIKRQFDPEGQKRKEVLHANPFVSDSLMVRIGGTTCLDYTRKGWGKRGNMEKFITMNSWQREDCIYFGDQLYPGGNDSDVIGLAGTIQVANPNELLNTLNNVV